MNPVDAFLNAAMNNQALLVQEVPDITLGNPNAIGSKAGNPVQPAYSTGDAKNLNLWDWFTGNYPTPNIFGAPLGSTATPDQVAANTFQARNAAQAAQGNVFVKPIAYATFGLIAALLIYAFVSQK